ncbi:DUF4272 domain-containing protein [Pontibacter ruber]|uniref:DUF4272 domain-containing protein n=1 Tax=Pontibacter ruber TaxID=1343895 RepID=A0ABW5CSX0_9BACT|nr:DUF4272 domain-containing protein [Pontibacter ruber]
MNFLNLFGTSKHKTAEQRKQQTEKNLRELGVPVNPHLPFVEDYATAKIRNSQEVVRRLIILSVMVDCVHAYDELTRESTVEYFKRMGLWEYVSENEKVYLQSKKANKQFENELSWRTEAMKVLFWALGFIEKLDLPTEQADVYNAHQATQRKYKSLKEFIGKAKLRSTEEILDETDFIYRAHWAVRNAELQGQEVPANFSSDIVYERHYAFNWLTCYAEDWDDITCDT